MAIVDSFGKTLSVCKKGLSLESGKPVFLPLFAGECNVPAESDNSTSPAMERLMEEKQGGIGPFTKEQNYEMKDDSTETISKERAASLSSSKGLGPFTKEQNVRMVERKENFKASNFEETSSRGSGSNNPWNIVDISSDGDSNSLENSDSERGRGFSGLNFFGARSSSSPDPSVEPTTEFLPEIREPVLQVDKKETGRSLKFPEITEPILRPRSARQNTRNEVHGREKPKEEIQETSSTSRAFTVQFLPERLAGILAQAERYARQTLLPLISQYTPSFVTGTRFEEPKYFPPLGEIASENHRETNESAMTTNNDRQRQRSDDRIDNTESFTEEKAKNSSNATSMEVLPLTETNYQERDLNSTRIDESNEWTPVEHSTTLNSISRKDFDASRSLNWEHEKYNWSVQATLENSSSEMDDWVPITVKSEIEMSETSNNVSNEIGLTHAVTDKQIETVQTSGQEALTMKNARNNTDEERGKDERKYIPLINPSTEELSSTSTNNISETGSSSSSTYSPYSHIQKIPRPIKTRRSMVFPYAYEKKKDPRTRYIPLIPEEDMGRPHFSFERER